MGAWLKLFKDGTKEYGSDENIIKRKASWSLGRLKDITEVRLFNLSKEAGLLVPETSWHQFDRYQVIITTGTQQSEITHRVVQAEIKPHHVGQLLVGSPIGNCCFWGVVQNVEDFKKNSFFQKTITKDHIGKWLTVILSEEDPPAIVFSTRGQMYDHQRISRQRS